LRNRALNREIRLRLAQSTQFQRVGRTVVPVVALVDEAGFGHHGLSGPPRLWAPRDEKRDAPQQAAALSALHVGVGHLEAEASSSTSRLFSMPERASAWERYRLPRGSSHARAASYENLPRIVARKTQAAALGEARRLAHRERGAKKENQQRFMHRSSGRALFLRSSTGLLCAFLYRVAGFTTPAAGL